MNTEKFELVAKTFAGLEEVLAGELRAIGAEQVTPGRRMVSFQGDKEVMYKANLCCRTALRVLKPLTKFIASDPDSLYSLTKEYDWSSILSPDSTFSIDSVVYSETFNHSRYVTYRVKDAIVDYFQDRYGAGHRPGVRLQDADVMINVHIDETRVTLSLDSSGESLHKRGYRVEQTEAPINEVLAAGILMLAGYDGTRPLVDPMCGSGTFLIEAAMIAANINPGVYRRSFAFEHWPDFDEELFERLYNDDSDERPVIMPIVGADISPKAIAIAGKNARSAGVMKYLSLEVKPLAQWDEAPEGGVLVTNPPYGERLNVEDLDGLYSTLGSKLKHVFTGYDAWVIGYRDDTFKHIGLSPSQKIPLYNGSLECQLRQYVIFDGAYKDFRADGHSLRDETPVREKIKSRRPTDDEWRRDARKKGFGGKSAGGAKWNKGGKDAPRGKSFKKTGDNTDRRDFRQDGDRPANGFGRKPKFTGRKFDTRPAAAQTSAEQSENPRAIKRNEKMLNEILSRKPQGATVMHKRGWRKSGDKPSDNE